VEGDKFGGSLETAVEELVEANQEGSRREPRLKPLSPFKLKVVLRDRVRNVETFIRE